MSRIGKQPIEIPQGVEVTLDDNIVTVKGKLGELSLEHSREVALEKQDNQIVVSIVRKRAESPALWGLYRSLVANMVKGVSEGFEKRLEIQGVGYRAEMKGKDLVLNLGYSHPVVMTPPEGVTVQVEGNNAIVVSGIDRQAVGQMAANIRSKRKPEPYKGKGVRYAGEYVRQKQGKRAATAG